MPYIKQERRKEIDANVMMICRNAGELNYKITTLVRTFLTHTAMGENYASYNEAIGVLECAKLELYRRKVALYEDKKIIENGDVY